MTKDPAGSKRTALRDAEDAGGRTPRRYKELLPLMHPAVEGFSLELDHFLRSEGYEESWADCDLMWVWTRAGMELAHMQQELQKANPDKDRLKLQSIAAGGYMALAYRILTEDPKAPPF